VAIDELAISAPVTPAPDSRVSRGPLGLITTTLRTTRGRVGAALVMFVVLVSVIGPFVAPHSPTDLVSGSFVPPGNGYPLGTDYLGRDAFSRLLNGGWELLAMAACATVLGVAVGALVGVLAAFEGGWLDSILMRTVDVLLAFPQIVFALLLVSIIGPKVWLIVLAVAIAHAPQVARVIRSAALDVCERDFVKSVELIAIPRRKIMTGEVLPNLISPLMVEFGLRLTFSIIIIAGLSFLGFGLQPPSPNWGSMINENRVGLVANPWPVIAPILMLVILTVGMNTFTDAVARVSLGTLRAHRERHKPRRRVRGIRGTAAEPGQEPDRG
jgi:peptide/nickel transport system permease protein